MVTVKCDKILCQNNYHDVCINNNIELMNGECLECKENRTVSDYIQKECKGCGAVYTILTSHNDGKNICQHCACRF